MARIWFVYWFEWGILDRGSESMSWGNDSGDYSMVRGGFEKGRNDETQCPVGHTVQ